jgi:hypothetical protein
MQSTAVQGKTLTASIVVAAAALVFGCAATPYQPKGYQGGYSEQQVNERSFWSSL